MNKFSDFKKLQLNNIVEDITSVTNDTALSSISNPINGMLVKTLHDLSLNIYDSTNSKWTKFNNSFVDPSEFGNWVLHDEREFNNTVIDYTLSGIDGNVNEKWLFEVEGNQTNALNPDLPIYIAINGDVTTTYSCARQFGGTTTSGDAIYSTTKGIPLVCSSNIFKDFYGNTVLNTKVTGYYRHSIGNFTSSNGGSVYCWQIGGNWTNLTDKITSFRIYSDALTIVKCKIKVYKWQDLKPVELHSYELVKEYNLSNQNINDMITQDGEVDDILYFESSVIQAGAGFIKITPNDITTNFNYSHIYQNGSNVSGDINAGTGFYIGGLGVINRHSYSHGSIVLKSGKYRQQISQVALYDPSAVNHINLIRAVNQGDTTTKITYLRVTTDGTLFTGNLRIYKLAKTHLICNNPNLLNGMQQKSIDSNTIEIQPGEIEIAGVVCNQTSKLQLTLSGNLRTGESESPSTYYYLYAIKGTGRTLSYKFSSTKPTLDRYGNTIDFDTAENEGLYHPVEGTTQRYIGQVYNDGTSNIIQFDKCSPSYQEGISTSIPGTGGRIISHGFARIPKNTQFLFKLNLADSTWVSDNAYYVSGSNTYGVFVDQNLPTINTVTPNFAPQGMYYYTGSQRTTGYYKLIVKK